MLGSIQVAPKQSRYVAKLHLCCGNTPRRCRLGAGNSGYSPHSAETMYLPNACCRPMKSPAKTRKNTGQSALFGEGGGTIALRGRPILAGPARRANCDLKPGPPCFGPPNGCPRLCETALESPLLSLRSCKARRKIRYARAVVGREVPQHRWRSALPRPSGRVRTVTTLTIPKATTPRAA